MGLVSNRCSYEVCYSLVYKFAAIIGLPSNSDRKKTVHCTSHFRARAQAVKGIANVIAKVTAKTVSENQAGSTLLTGESTDVPFSHHKTTEEFFFNSEIRPPVDTQPTGATMSPFLRIGLSNFDCGSCQSCQGEAVNPYCAVLVKEYVESENGQMYIQKKPTMYPPWDSTFDAHINKGRVMQIIVKGKNVDLISETTCGALLTG
ncbi:hypothetical protein H8959_011877 [Pygathrix nigripes]